MATHDYVIDNGTGQAVRQDINNVLQAILTNNSNGTSPSTTQAYMFWADTANNKLMIRNSSNNGWVELLQLDGTITIENGSASAPGLAFRNDLDTGIFQGATGDLRITTGGTEVMRIENTNVGIGAGLTSVPRSLTIRTGVTNDGIRIINASDQTVAELGGADTDNDTGLLTLSNNGSQFIQFNANGTSFIKNTLGLVVGSDNTVRGLGTFVNTAGDCNVAITSSNSGNAQLLLGDEDADAGKIQYANNDNSMRFGTNAAEAMMLSALKNLHIGSTEQGHPNFDDLNVGTTVSGDHGITVFANPSNSGTIAFADTTAGDDRFIGFILYNHASNFLQLKANNSGTTPSTIHLVSTGQVTFDGASSATQSTYGGTVQFNGFHGKFGATGSTQGHVMNFAWNSPSVLAYVDVNQIGVAATSSDYRVKKNITLQTAAGIDRVKLLKPSTFEYDDYKGTWVADGITREGFIAHEVQEVIPTGATGTKDGDEIQALQTDAILSVVTKALQEAITKIETLETEVAALKAA